MGKTDLEKAQELLKIYKTEKREADRLFEQYCILLSNEESTDVAEVSTRTEEILEQYEEQKHYADGMAHLTLKYIIQADVISEKLEN